MLLYPIIDAAVHPYGNEHAARHRHEMMLRALGFFTRLPIGSAPLPPTFGASPSGCPWWAHHRHAHPSRSALRHSSCPPPVRRHRLPCLGRRDGRTAS
ncbi:MAG: hypothetical protein ACLT2T_09665 [Bilophila wadsworthia]